MERLFFTPGEVSGPVGLLVFFSSVQEDALWDFCDFELGVFEISSKREAVVFL